MSSLKQSARIDMSHGSGGKAMQKLIKDVFVSRFNNDYLAQGEDQARFSLASLAALGDQLAFTTDSYVVDPLFFPGGDIGKLAVSGTVNDLAVGGAKPLFLSCGIIMEEGLPIEVLEQVIDSMQATATKAGVHIVTGDTKVVQKGACDQLFINTSGVGVIRSGVNCLATEIQPDDCIIINGYLGDHGAAIVDARGELALQNKIESDCKPLNDLIGHVLDICPHVRAMRDATRGGLATVVNEFSQACGWQIELDEAALPIRDDVRGVCEILGLDPLYLANEGKVVLVVPNEQASKVLEVMRAHPDGQDSAIIGCVTLQNRKRVTLKTLFGSQRIVDTLVGEQLPRIC